MELDDAVTVSRAAQENGLVLTRCCAAPSGIALHCISAAAVTRALQHVPALIEQQLDGMNTLEYLLNSNAHTAAEAFQQRLLPALCGCAALRVLAIGGVFACAATRCSLQRSSCQGCRRFTPSQSLTMHCCSARCAPCAAPLRALLKPERAVGLQQLVLSDIATLQPLLRAPACTSLRALALPMAPLAADSVPLAHLALAGITRLRCTLHYLHELAPWCLAVRALDRWGYAWSRQKLQRVRGLADLLFSMGPAQPVLRTSSPRKVALDDVGVRVLMASAVAALLARRVAPGESLSLT